MACHVAHLLERERLLVDAHVHLDHERRTLDEVDLLLGLLARPLSYRLVGLLACAAEGLRHGVERVEGVVRARPPGHVAARARGPGESRRSRYFRGGQSGHDVLCWRDEQYSSAIASISATRVSIYKFCLYLLTD